MTTAIDRLRDAMGAWTCGVDSAGDRLAALYEDVLDEHEAISADRDRLAGNIDAMAATLTDERDVRHAVEADRDRLAARVDELEQVIARYDDTDDFARVRATAEEKVIARLATRVAELEATLRVCGDALADDLKKPRDADPCPVSSGVLGLWRRGIAAEGSIENMAEQIAWLTRQVLRAKEGV
jgi:hypothetical protein